MYKEVERPCYVSGISIESFTSGAQGSGVQGSVIIWVYFTFNDVGLIVCISLKMNTNTLWDHLLINLKILTWKKNFTIEQPNCTI